MPIAYVLLSLIVAVGSPAPATTPAAAAVASVAPLPSAQPLAPVLINNVLFRAVEFDAGKAVWRNLAITVTDERLAAWRALSPAVKNQYAEQMIDNYRTGMKYSRNIKLTFVDERSATLDQYLWTAPAPAPAPERK